MQYQSTADPPDTASPSAVARDLPSKGEAEVREERKERERQGKGPRETVRVEEERPVVRKGQGESEPLGLGERSGRKGKPEEAGKREGKRYKHRC